MCLQDVSAVENKCRQQEEITVHPSTLIYGLGKQVTG